MSCCGGSCGGPVVPTTPKPREMGEFSAENGCKCGSDCKCDPCTCSK